MSGSNQRSSRRGGWTHRRFVALLFVGCLLCLAGTTALAQSGRRSPSRTPQPTPTPAASTDTGPSEGESESQPRASSTTQSPASSTTFIIYADDMSSFDFPQYYRDYVMDSFYRRMGQSRALKLERAGRGTRKDARDRAKKEKDAFVVLLQLEQDASAQTRGTLGRPDASSLVVVTSVYAPVSGELKFTDRVWQRPYRASTTIGGVRIPVPTQRSGRYPDEYQLQQLGQDTADRIMMHFNIIPPSDR